MEDKKFTQKEVIKALECCINDDCDNCPNGFGNCERNLAEISLDLINRLKTRIVRYQLKNTNQRNALASLNKKVAEQKAEIERLDALWNSAQDNNFNILALLHKMNKELRTAKEDNERHKAEVKWWKSQIRDTEDLLAEFDRPIVEVRNEAIKEFAEKFREKSGSIVTSCQGYEIYETKQYQISAINFDNLVKEMTEVEK